MPGIAGIITRGCPQKSRDDLKAMIASMTHESFYVTGMYVDEAVGLYGGCVAHPDSFSGSMPVLNEKKDIALIFSGENYLERQSLTNLGVDGQLVDESHPGYLLRMYEMDPKGFLAKLNGWFSGVLVDRREKTILLFNDRYGMGRIYYHEDPEAFYFASEAKALLKVKPELREIDLRSLGEVFGCGSVLQNRSLFKGIRLLPGGSAWTFRFESHPRKETYFSILDWEHKSALDGETYYHGLKEILLSKLPRYFVAKSPLAISLTGGLDTRLIMAYQFCSGGTLPSYTFGGLHGEVLDIRIARALAAKCHWPHTVVRLDPQFLSRFSDHAEKTIYVTDGTLDICGSHEVHLNALARQIAPIRMTGNYGSEVLRNASTFKMNAVCDGLLDRDFGRHIGEAALTFDEINTGHDLSVAAFKAIPWSLYGSLAAARSQLEVRTPYMDNELVEFAYRAPRDTRLTRSLFMRLIAEIDKTFMQLRTDRGIGGDSSATISKVIQLLYSVWFKMEWYYNEGMPHWLAKLDSVVAPIHQGVPVLASHKYLHYRLWFCNELSDYVKAVLLDQRTADRAYFNKKFLAKMVEGHVRGQRNYSHEINRSMTVELVHRTFIDN